MFAEKGRSTARFLTYSATILGGSPTGLWVRSWYPPKLVFQEGDVMFSMAIQFSGWKKHRQDREGYSLSLFCFMMCGRVFLVVLPYTCFRNIPLMYQQTRLVFCLPAPMRSFPWIAPLCVGWTLWSLFFWFWLPMPSIYPQTITCYPSNPQT